MALTNAERQAKHRAKRKLESAAFYANIRENKLMLNRPMTILANGKAQREFNLSREQYARLTTVPGFAPATLAQTMGPNWRHVFWLNVVTNNRPGKARPAVVCSDRLTLADVFQLIGYGES